MRVRFRRSPSPVTGLIPVPESGSELLSERQSAAAEWDQVLEFMWATNEYTNEYIRYADQKASVAVVFSTGALSLFHSQGIFAALVDGPLLRWGALHWLALVSVALLAASVLLAAWAIRPRFRGGNRPGYVYWGSVVAHGSAPAFWKAIREEPSEGLAEHMSVQLFHASAICDRKYLWVNRSIFSAIVGGLLAGLLLAIRL